jgi:hypothetical protein
MELILAAAGIVGLAAFLSQAKSLPSEADFKKAQEKLVTTPEDQDANTIVGKYLAFVLGKYDDAMIYLAKSGDKTLRTLAEHERAPLYADTAVKKVGMGDEWVVAAKSFKPLVRIFYDRAATWYGDAWAELKTQPLWGDKLRERLQKIYTVTPGLAAPKNLTCPTGWKCPIADTKAGRSQTAARSGQYSFAITGWKSPLPAYGALEQAVDVKPGTYKISGWAITDGTDADDSFLVNIQNANGTNLVLHPIILAFDKPWWRRVEAELVVPPGGVHMGISVVVGAKQGMIYVDDLSIKGPDGKELLKNGSFEDR